MYYPNIVNLLQRDLIRFIFATLNKEINLRSSSLFASTGFKLLTGFIESQQKHYNMFTYPWEHEHSPWLDILLGTGWQQKSNLCTLWLNLSNCSYACFWSTKKSCDCNLNFSYFNCLEINVALWFILTCNLYCLVINIKLHLNHHFNLNHISAYLNELRLRVYSHTVPM